MTSKSFPELDALRVEVDPSVGARHRDAIGTAIETAGPSPLPPPERGMPAWKKWLAGLAIGGGVLVPAAAYASESAVPGDALYPLKKALEPLVELVDDDVVAEHRIEELEILVERDGADDDIASLIDQATDALAERDQPRLTARLGVVLDRLTDRQNRPGRSDPPADPSAPTPQPTDRTEPTPRSDTPPVERPEPTAQPEVDEPPERPAAEPPPEPTPIREGQPADRPPAAPADSPQGPASDEPTGEPTPTPTPVADAGREPEASDADRDARG